MAKQRIAYVDFMKGLCIILVVAFHIDRNAMGYHTNEMLQSFRVPMYFFLSGLFFKLYDGFADFVRRKVNNIFIPLVFFFLLGAVYLFCMALYHSHFSVAGAWALMPHEIIRVNTPLWFLVVLFEVNVIYYLLQKLLPRLWSVVVAIALSGVGYVLACNGVRLIFMLDIALVALPYFILGTEVRKAGWLEQGPHLAVRIIFALMVVAVLYFFAEKINMQERSFPDYLRLYLLPCLSILALMFICQYMKRPVPFISHLGRYSIIVLGTHQYLIAYGRKVAGMVLHEAGGAFAAFLVVLAVVLTLEYPVIYLLRRFAPRFTAQEPFFHERWRLKPAKALT